MNNDTLNTDEERFLQFITQMRFEDLPSSVISVCESAIIDHFASAIFGMQLPWTGIVRRVALEQGSVMSSGGAFIYGTDLAVRLEDAALINGTAAHAFEMDDIDHAGIGHPGCVVCTAAIAASVSVGGSGRDLITAIVAGYEVMGRLGRAVGPKASIQGFHTTGFNGAIAAAAAACISMKMPSELVRAAIAIATSFGSGIKAFQHGNGMVKRLHAGRAAAAGLYAALLVRSGFIGPREALSGRYGYIPVMSFGELPRFEELSSNLGERFLIEGTYIKPFASCGANHAAILACEQFLAEDAGIVDHIEEIIIGVCERTRTANSIPVPQDVMSAQYSIEYGVALALLGSARDPSRFLEFDSTDNLRARDLGGRVRVVLDEEAERAYPCGLDARVTILLRDGAKLTTYQASRQGLEDQIWASAESKLREVYSRVGGAADGNNSVRCSELLNAVRKLKFDGEGQECIRALPRTDS